mmetsp:Transcript_15488/g.50927  ORF Transcript_15488/g.50927 Transcript_15488/m.50927 type:complete len:242 (+) Transcript_15488:1060-1785(+)
MLFFSQQSFVQSTKRISHAVCQCPHARLAALHRLFPPPLSHASSTSAVAGAGPAPPVRPSCPCAFEPKVRRTDPAPSPAVSSAANTAECLAPAPTALTSVSASSATPTGIDAIFGADGPHCPSSFQPHAYRWPAAVHASACHTPSATLVTGSPSRRDTRRGANSSWSSPCASCPYVPQPHVYKAPSELTAALLRAPAAMALARWRRTGPAGPLSGRRATGEAECTTSPPRPSWPCFPQPQA